MAQTLTVSESGLFFGAAADYRRSLEDAIGFRDRMDERTRRTRYVSITGPIVGPRGGTRRPSMRSDSKAFEDHVCEDVDVEEAVIARLDSELMTIEDFKDVEGFFHSDEEEEDDLETDGEESIDSSVTVAGVPLEEYLATRGDDEIVKGDYGLTCDDSPPTAEETFQEELEAADRTDAYLDERIWESHLRDFGHRNDASIRTQAFDRIADRDPWSVYVKLDDLIEVEDFIDLIEVESLEMGFLDWEEERKFDLLFQAAQDIECVSCIMGCSETAEALWVDDRLDEFIRFDDERYAAA